MFSDFIEECCEDTSFDIENVMKNANEFFDSETETASDDVLDNIKAKVITRLLRKTFISAALSKRQIERMNKVIKAIVVLLSNENETTARKLFAGYMSCQRDARKSHETRQIHVDKCFET